jgi:hypothetical protein
MNKLACRVEPALSSNSLLGKSFVRYGSAIYFDTDGSHVGYALSTLPFTKSPNLPQICTYVIRGTTISFIICSGGLTPGTYGTYDTATGTLNFSGNGWTLLYDESNPSAFGSSYPPRVELVAGTSHTIRLLYYTGLDSDTFTLHESGSEFTYDSTTFANLKNSYTIPNLYTGWTYGSIVLTKNGSNSFDLLVPTVTG